MAKENSPRLVVDLCDQPVRIAFDIKYREPSRRIGRRHVAPLYWIRKMRTCPHKIRKPRTSERMPRGTPSVLGLRVLTPSANSPPFLVAEIFLDKPVISAIMFGR
jgi:hypothetical protein